MRWGRLSGLLTSDHGAASPQAYLHTGSKVAQDGPLALEESKMAATFIFLLLSKMNMHSKGTCQAQPKPSGSCQDSYTSLIICLVTSISHTHTHTNTYVYNRNFLYYNCNFLNEAFKSVFSVMLCLDQLSTRSKL